MTIIVFDGCSIAADRLLVIDDFYTTTCKLRVYKRTANVIAWTGINEQGLALMEWYEAGADIEK